MLDGWFVCIIAIPIGAALRLLTMLVASSREKAWRWVAYVVPTVVIVAILLLAPGMAGRDPMMATAMVAVFAFWCLTGAALGAAIATRLVQGEPRA